MIGRGDCCGIAVTTGRALADASKTSFPTQAPARVGRVRGVRRSVIGCQCDGPCQRPEGQGDGIRSSCSSLVGFPASGISSRLLFPLPPFTFNAGNRWVCIGDALY